MTTDTPHFHIWMPAERSLCDQRSRAGGQSPAHDLEELVGSRSPRVPRAASTRERVLAWADQHEMTAREIRNRPDEIARAVDTWDRQYPWCPGCLVLAERIASWGRQMVTDHPSPKRTPDKAVEMRKGTRGNIVPLLKTQPENYRFTVFPAAPQRVDRR